MRDEANEENNLSLEHGHCSQSGRLRGPVGKWMALKNTDFVYAIRSESANDALLM